MKSGQALPVSKLRAATQGNPQPPKIPAPRTSGLAWSFCRFPHNQPFCCFFLSHFLQNSKKDVCTPTATTVLHLCQKKKQLKAIIHNM